MQRAAQYIEDVMPVIRREVQKKEAPPKKAKPGQEVSGCVALLDLVMVMVGAAYGDRCGVGVVLTVGVYSPEFKKDGCGNHKVLGMCPRVGVDAAQARCRPIT
jgi:hypothetical protein